MNELIVIVEGQTEQAFVTRQLAGHLALHGISAWPVLPGRARRYGGVRDWSSAKDDMVRALKESPVRYVTTMFDYYALPESWPGRVESKDFSFRQKAAHVEAAVAEAIAQEMGERFDPRRFIPYIQMHEFEALAYSDVDVLAATLAPLTKSTTAVLSTHFEQILASVDNDPEAINDNYHTCPSRRIAKKVKGYRKAAFGPTLTSRIGLDRLRDRCRHFGEWMDRLESISL